MMRRTLLVEHSATASRQQAPWTRDSAENKFSEKTQPFYKVSKGADIRCTRCGGATGTGTSLACDPALRLCRSRNASLTLTHPCMRVPAPSRNHCPPVLGPSITTGAFAKALPQARSCKGKAQRWYLDGARRGGCASAAARRSSHYFLFTKNRFVTEIA